MWWWQSQALAGALSLGGSVPSDHLTGWAAAPRPPSERKPAAAPADTVINTSRRSNPPLVIFGQSLARQTSARRRSGPIGGDRYYWLPTREKEKAYGERTRRRHRSRSHQGRGHRASQRRHADRRLSRTAEPARKLPRHRRDPGGLRAGRPHLRPRP